MDLLNINLDEENKIVQNRLGNTNQSIVESTGTSDLEPPEGRRLARDRPEFI